ncbi:DUF1566 domain-containing protein [Variovorax sp.]|uniref:DUF1566 domain-containing protein n=1 Tax=Variovorax sp. TaxID=1871043 RepID=UPI003BAA3F23
MTTTSTVALGDLPAIGARLEGGTFAGVISLPDGKHVAVILLPGKGEELDWKAATAWAEKHGGELPSRPVAALLYANVKAELTPDWHWTNEAFGASCAWTCYFDSGYQGNHRESCEGSAVAVRLIPLTA